MPAISIVPAPKIIKTQSPSKWMASIYSPKENLKHIFPKSQYRDLASKYQIHIPKQIFTIPCGPSLPMRPKARVLALISVMPKLISAVY